MGQSSKRLSFATAALVASALCATAAFAGGRPNASTAVDGHLICMVGDGWANTLEIVTYPNGTAVLLEDREVEMYGARRGGGGFAFSSVECEDELGGEVQGSVIIFNRDGTWCAYDFDGWEPDGEECGTWTLDACPPRRESGGSFLDHLRR